MTLDASSDFRHDAAAQMQPFSASDKRQLDAADGWLGLGDWRSANDELDEIASEVRLHPDVLKLRCKVYEAARRWVWAADVGAALTMLLPNYAPGWLQAAHGLYQLRRTYEAREMLSSVADKFKDEWRLTYQLAVYNCQLGNLEAAYHWLEKTFDLKPAAKTIALNDPELERVWVDISDT